MREIKFRAWDERKNKMFNVFWMKRKTNLDFICANDERNLEWTRCPAESYAYKDIMQYTWLKDKNWVEIYEGDIIKQWPEKYSQIYDVIFQNWTFICNQKTSDFMETEVIGNKRENPDLLTKQDNE